MLTVERLKELVRFDYEKGRFFWLRETGKGIKLSKNGEVGSYDSHGYGQVRLDKKIYKEHRLVWLYHYGVWPEKQIDHINHERRDNRIENLREVSNQENSKNRPKQKNNTSGYQGVSFNKTRKKYHAYITIDGYRLTIGNYECLDDAIAARKEKEVEFGYSEMHGVGEGRRKHKPLRFATYEDFRKFRTDQRKIQKTG